MTQMVEVKCLQCGNPKKVRMVDVKRGHGKFCNKLCANKYIGKHRPPETMVKVLCDGCGKTFDRKPSKVSIGKSGLNFCNRDCKDHSQKIGGINAIQPPHYRGAENFVPASYRDQALRALEHKCNRCGWDTHPKILQVHHKDRNRNNNDISNLEIVCPNCHALEHWG